MILLDKIKIIFRYLKTRDILLLLLTILACNRVTSWIPAYKAIYPFPFYRILDENGNEVGITIQSYFFMLCGHALMIAFWYYCQKKEPDRKWLFRRYKIIEWLSLFDFFLIYEQSFYPNKIYNVEFTDFRILFYFYFYIRWNLKK